LKSLFAHMLKVLLLAISVASAVKFDLESTLEGTTSCISQYIPKDILCSAILDIAVGANQKVSIIVRDKSPSSNQFYSKPDLSGQVKFSFTTHEWADVDFCFTNTLAPGSSPSPDTYTTVNFHIDTGAEAADYTEVKRKEKLTDLEVEMLRLENVVKDLTAELEYLHKAEFQMRDTNEDANDRIKWFSLLSMSVLIGVGMWQIWYLRRFFQSKKLI